MVEYVEAEDGNVDDDVAELHFARNPLTSWLVAGLGAGAEFGSVIYQVGQQQRWACTRIYPCPA